MLIIEDKLISEDVIEKEFVCDLNKCKGACCWEGDYGAPLESAEISKIEEIYEVVETYLTTENIEEIETKGKFAEYKEPGFEGTALFEDGRCVFMTKNELGISQCSFEMAYRDGKTDFKKPISCHLYPIRAKNIGNTEFEALNYSKWSICSAACTNGQKLKIPVYEFAKEAIIRKYGSDFYKQLAAAAKKLEN